MEEEISIIEEIKKCKKSPYYFCTKYMTIDGKPFTTSMDEESFNFTVNKILKLQMRRGRV